MMLQILAENIYTVSLYAEATMFYIIIQPFLILILKIKYIKKIYNLADVLSERQVNVH